MPLSDEDYNRHSTYFGVYSASQAARVSELLKSLGVRFEFVRRGARRRATEGVDSVESSRHQPTRGS